MELKNFLSFYSKFKQEIITYVKQQNTIIVEK